MWFIHVSGNAQKKGVRMKIETELSRLDDVHLAMRFENAKYYFIHSKPGTAEVYKDVLIEILKERVRRAEGKV